MMNQNLAILKATRDNLLGVTSKLSVEQLNLIPSALNNNLAWNLGHVVVTQQLLCYRMSGLPCKVDNNIIEKYRKGSRPEGRIEAEELEHIRGLMKSTISEMEADIAKNIFQDYKSYRTSYNFQLDSFADALAFNNIHEAMHLGTCINLRKLVA